MATIIPQKNEFDLAEKYHKILEKCELVFISFSILVTFVRFLPFYQSNIEYIFTILTIMSVIAVFFFQLRFETTYMTAEEIRRDGLIDNVFSSKMADVQSNGYYDTDDVDEGMRRLLANIHENCFFSIRVTGPMFIKEEKKNIWFIIIMVIAILFSIINSQFVLAMLQIFLSMNFCGNYLRIMRLRESLNKVLTECKKIWEDWNSGHKALQLQARVIRETIRYESALAYASIMFDQSAYETMNTTVTMEWEVLKERYQMQQIKQ